MPSTRAPPEAVDASCSWTTARNYAPAVASARKSLRIGATVIGILSTAEVGGCMAAGTEPHWKTKIDLEPRSRSQFAAPGAARRASPPAAAPFSSGSSSYNSGNFRGPLGRAPAGPTDGNLREGFCTVPPEDPDYRILRRVPSRYIAGYPLSLREEKKPESVEVLDQPKIASLFINRRKHRPPPVGRYR
jgi:hypothetical protein